MMFACSSDSVETGGDSSAANSEYGMSGGTPQAPLSFAESPADMSDRPSTNSTNVDLIEICDGFDNDADGKVDENGCTCDGDVVCFAGPPEKRGVGECTDGERQCGPGGELFGACIGSVGPSDELCDELDNDCDGVVDENCCEELPCDPTPDPNTSMGASLVLVLVLTVARRHSLSVNIRQQLPLIFSWSSTIRVRCATPFGRWKTTWERLVNVWRVQASISNLLFCRGAARVADRRTSAGTSHGRP